MNELEEQCVRGVTRAVDAQLQNCAGGSWEARRIAANDLLSAVNTAWWTVYRSDPSGYKRDLEFLNQLAGWSGKHAQVDIWRGGSGRDLLMPPKFFGGNALTLDERFVASVSLNHGILPSGNMNFEAELDDQQDADRAFRAHREYFNRSYAYGRFFQPRANVLRAYAATLRLQVEDTWQAVNSRLAFYIESFATRSERFKPPRNVLRGSQDSLVV